MHQISEFMEIGASINYNSYFAGHYSTGNHNLVTNGSKRNHNLPPDQLLGYYKEALKHTMVRQETILRGQIQDLHRLYGRQRELMDELRRNELFQHQLKMEPSQLTTALSQSSSLRVQKELHNPSLPLVNPVCSQISVSCAESIQSPSCFFRGRNIQACSYPTQTEGLSGDCEMLESNSKCKKLQKNFLDLELPADEYVVGEEEELLENGKFHKAPEVSSSHLKRSSEVVCDGDVKQLLGTSGLSSVSEVDTSTTASLEKGSDLNYLYKLEEETSPTFDNLVGSTSHREISCIDVSRKRKSDLQFLSKEFIKDSRTRQDFEACSNVLLEERKNNQDWSSYTCGTGKWKRTLSSVPQDCNAEKLSALSSLLHVEHKQAEPPTCHQGNQNSWSERTIFGLQSSGRNSSQSGQSGTSSMRTPYQPIPQEKMANSGSACISASGIPIHDFARVPIAVQPLPCFNTSVPFSNCSESSTGRLGLDGDRLLLKKDLRSSTNHGRAVFLDSSFSMGSQFESKNSEAHPPLINFDNQSRINDNFVSEDHGSKKYVQDFANVKSPKDINLNVMPSCSLDVEVSQSFQATTGSEKHEGSNVELQWHRPKLVHNSKTDRGCEDSNQGDTSDLSSKRIHGSACEKPKISSDCCSHGSPSNDNLNLAEDVKNREKHVVFDLNLACDSVLDAEIELTEHFGENEIDMKDVGSGFQIDLNSCLSGDEFSPMSSLSKEILLEAPASPENKECSPPRGDSDQNQAETPLLLSGQEDVENQDCSLPIGESDANKKETSLPLSGDSGQKVDVEDDLVRTAAESLASISSSELHTCIVRTTDKPCDYLRWFAGLASAVVGGSENKAGLVLNEEVLPDGMDYFEVMTLNLTETKVAECCYRSNGHKEEEMGTTSLRYQPRKGRKRKGRQRKDFQSEILPTMVSLSRYEVTEDLQTIGGLIESVRCATKLGLARGGRRSSISSPTVSENTLESLLKQIGSKSQFGKEERRVIGWGEVTRRRRGQRYPVSKPRLILSQV